MARRSAEAGTGPWCSICGSKVDHLIPTFDPRHPIGECHYVDKQGIAHGHGRVPAVLDFDELLTIQRKRQHDADAQRHFKHLADIPVIGCRVCKAKYADQYEQRREARNVSVGSSRG